MDARQLRTFLKTIELGSISRAALDLGIAQPSLSQQLLRLEDEVGAKLFRRTARGVTTTEAGRVFEEHARHILRSIDQALEDVRQLSDEPSGPVTFAMPMSVSVVLGLTLVKAVLQHAPGVHLRLTEAYSGHIRNWLDEGAIDLGVLYDVGPLRHLSVKRLVSEVLYVIGPAGRFAGIEAPSLALSDLDQTPMILPSPQHGLRQFFDREAQRLGFTLNVKAEVDALAHITSLVADGHGCTIMSLPAVHAELQAGRVSAARIENDAIRRTVCLVRNPSCVVTRASVRVEDLTLKVMRSLIATGRWRAEPLPALG
jgi:LysR family nitrogen assimilation transcriptional regulator